jgi:hypothetical protein
MSARAGGAGCAAWRASSASASVRSRSLASQRDSSVRATSRWSGVALVEGAFGAGGVVAGAFDAQFDGAGRASGAVGDGIGGRQGKRDLVGRDGGQQPLGDRPLDQFAHHAATGRRVDLVAAAVSAVIARPGGAVVGGHRAPAAAAADEALQQRAAGPGRTRALAGVVGRQPLLVAHELLPADVAGVELTTPHRSRGKIVVLAWMLPSGSTRRRLARRPNT